MNLKPKILDWYISRKFIFTFFFLLLHKYFCIQLSNFIFYGIIFLYSNI